MSSTPKTNAPVSDKQSIREHIPGNRDCATSDNSTAMTGMNRAGRLDAASKGVFRT